MPLPPNLTPVTPVPVVVQTAPLQTPAAPAFAQAPADAPTPVQASATIITPPPTMIGFTLAKIVLGITAASILLFLIYLIAMDFKIGRDIQGAYQGIVVPNRLAAEMLTAVGFDKFVVDLTQANKTPPAAWDAGSIQNAQNILKQVDLLPNISVEQKAKLKSCVPPPPESEKDRAIKLQACITIMGEIREPMLVAADAAADAKMASESTFRIGEQRQSLHNFWVQAAQLVLLNLLLPLLTALFGYIFGRQQEQKATS